MSAQLDMFGAGESDALPPWLDPEVCADYSYGVETDRDHVGAAEIGRVGNNGHCIVVAARDRDGRVLKAWRFDLEREEEAGRFYRDCAVQLQRNRQQTLFT